MSVSTIRPQLAEAAAAHARIVERFIDHVAEELDGATGDFQRESLQDLLDKLRSERENYARLATLRVVRDAA
jgi:hypothetical protein